MQTINIQIANLTCPLKKCTEQRLQLKTTITNKLITESAMPSCLKHAAKMPLLKSSGLEREDMKNSWHISYLPFVSKPV